MWYNLTLTPDDNGTWLVSSKDFPEVVSFGDTQEDACRNGRIAIEEAISRIIADSEAIPAPASEPNGKGRWVQMPLMVALKSTLYMLLRIRGISRAELARRLDWHREQVDRLFRLDHQSKLDAIEAAFEVLGVPVGLNVPFPVAA